MKNIINNIISKTLTLFLFILFNYGCEKDDVMENTYYGCRTSVSENNSDHPGADIYEELIGNIVASGVPGMMLTIHDENGYWSGADGVADIASGVSLKPCNITRTGSTVKTLTAVTILLLQEDGLLNINDPVIKYLSDIEISGLKNAESSTIRQLLEHSSGIYNYIRNARFQTASLNDLTKIWQPSELLKYARGMDPYFSPGTDVMYSNTNYILLGMIIEKVTGKKFYEIFSEKIFEPQGMKFTQFAATDPVPEGIIRGYVDFYSNLNLMNATYFSGWDYFTADGGLISNAFDLNLFMTNLFNNRILSNASMEQMLQWQAPEEQDSEGYETFYGLGIFKIITEFGPAYIHSGDAIGYFATMVFFPEQSITISWAVNANYGKVDEYTQSKSAMNSIFKTIVANP